MTILRNQIEALRHLATLDLKSGKLYSSTFEGMQVCTDPELWQRQQARIHAQAMALYEEKFESSKMMYFHDLWEYIDRKLASPDHATQIIHPASTNQHPSMPDKSKPYQAHQYVKQSLEIDTINDLSANLQRLIEDDLTPSPVRR